MMKIMVIRAIKWIKEKFLIISITTVIYFWGVWASLGLIFGYLATKYFSGPMEKERGKMPSLRMSIGKYNLHVHHWLVAASCLLTFQFSGILDPNNFIFWLGGGMALQGILCYNDWYKIVYKN